MSAAFDPQTVPGFLSAEEGECLRRLAALAAPPLVVEIGTYCGRSTAYLGLGAQSAGGRVLTIDTHRGSEEHQPGEAYHDPRLTDDRGRHDTIAAARSTIEKAGVSSTVSLFLGTSCEAAQWVGGNIGLLFIDGGHALDTVLSDWRAWNDHIRRRGYLALHDVYASPCDGGQGPRSVARLIAQSGLYDPAFQVGSLVVFCKL